MKAAIDRPKLAENEEALAHLRSLMSQTPRPSERAIAKELKYPHSTVRWNIKRIDAEAAEQKAEGAPPTAEGGEQTADEFIQQMPSSDPRDHRAESRERPIDSALLAQAVAEARRYPKATVYSPLVRSVLNYLDLTTPRYKMSEDIREMMEGAVRKKYPEICREVEGLK